MFISSRHKKWFSIILVYVASPWPLVLIWSNEISNAFYKAKIAREKFNKTTFSW